MRRFVATAFCRRFFDGKTYEEKVANRPNRATSPVLCNDYYKREPRLKFLQTHQKPGRAVSISSSIGLRTGDNTD